MRKIFPTPGKLIDYEKSVNCPPHSWSYFNGVLKCTLCNRFTEDIIK